MKTEGEQITLRVHDTGIGFPEGFDFRTTEPLGLQWEEIKIPIVYVTAYADEQTLAQARTPPPLITVRKPFDASQLRNTLEQAFATLR